MPHCLSIFRRSDGSTVVEYALLAPVLLLLLMGTLEFCLIMYASAVLDGATAAAARMAKTGYNNTSVSGIALWAAHTGYTSGQLVNNGGYIYICTGAGTSGGSGPAGTNTSGITDGTATWGFTCDATSQSRVSFIQCYLDWHIQPLLNPANITVAGKSYSGFNNVAQPEPYTDVSGVGHYVAGDPYTDVNGNGQWDADMGASGLGGPGDIVVYTASYPWPIFTPLVQQFFGNNGTVTISASSVVKNEPYNSR
jgi:Flp pilus assembly protein TadG